jgi:hypothetical protein
MPYMILIPDSELFPEDTIEILCVNLQTNTLARPIVSSVQSGLKSSITIDSCLLNVSYIGLIHSVRPLECVVVGKICHIRYCYR